MKTDLHRRRAGLLIGLVLGTGYSLTSNLVNRVVLPDIPLYTPPPGLTGLIIVSTLMFGMLGLIAAWTDEALPGVLLSALVGSVVSSVWMVVNETNKFAAVTLLLVVFMPRVFFFLPVGGLVRWLIHRFDLPKSAGLLRRLAPTFLAFILLAATGTSSILPRETRDALIKMDALLQTGMNSQAASREDLPKPLQSVQGFIQYARGGYRFTIGSNPDVLPVQRPMVAYGEPEPFIIVRFENGFRFGCVFSPPYIQPACIDF